MLWGRDDVQKAAQKIEDSVCQAKSGEYIV